MTKHNTPQVYPIPMLGDNPEIIIRDEFGLTEADWAEIIAEDIQHDRKVRWQLIRAVLFGGSGGSSGRDTDEFQGLRYCLAAFVAIFALLIGRRGSESNYYKSASIAYANAGVSYWGEAYGDTLCVHIASFSAWRDSM